MITMICCIGPSGASTIRIDEAECSSINNYSMNSLEVQ